MPHVWQDMVYEILQGKKISTVSTYLGGVGVELIESDLVSEKHWSAFDIKQTREIG